MVNIHCGQRYRIHRKHVLEVAQKYLQKYQIDEEDALNIVFVGKRKMKTISALYKGEDVALPVLSFLYDKDGVFGEIVICFPQAVLLAAERVRTVDQMLEELIKHGIDTLAS